jgi:hypothetical protein
MYQEVTFGTDRVLRILSALITILDEVEAVVKAVCAKCLVVGTPVSEFPIKLHRRWFMDVRHPMQTTRSVHNNLCIKLSFPKSVIPGVPPN